MTEISEEHKNFTLPLYVGKNEDYEDLFVDFAQIQNLLILGDSATGKTNIIYKMILSLIEKFSPDLCQIALFDPKAVEFYPFENVKHLFCNAKLVDCIPYLKQIDNVIHERYKILSEANCISIEQYNAVSENKMPYIVCFIDEIADLIIYHPDETIELLEDIIHGRTVGILLVISTRETMPEVLTPKIRLLFKNFIIFAISEARCDVDYMQTYLDGIDPWNIDDRDGHILKLEYEEPKVLLGQYITESEITKALAQINQ